MVSIGEHVRATGEAAPAGIYRVVGTPDSVTLLRVGDADGRRRHTGELVSVPPERLEQSFEPAEEPGTGPGVRRLVLEPIRNLRWSVYAAWLALRRRLP